MARKAVLAFCLLLIGSQLTFAKKKSILLPEDVLQAQTAVVLIDPEAGIPLDHPYANRIARGDVENALQDWGRFRLTTDVATADLVIVVRKGSGKIANATIGGVPQNRPATFPSGDASAGIGADRGNPPMAGGPIATQAPHPSPQIEAGPLQDLFTVYRGRRDDALDSPPVWRYESKDALRSPSVPAVDEFRKLIIEAEKQRNQRP